MQIGIIGSGHIGSTVGRLLAAAGHTVCFGTRRPEAVRERLHELSLDARVASVADAVTSSEVVLVAVPFGCWPELAEAHGAALRGRIVLDPTNPYPQRDGDFARQAIEAGEGAPMAVAKLLPGVSLVRAFNSVFWRTLESDAFREGGRIGVPLAGDDVSALDVAAQLVTDAGFDPVVVGPLRRAREFDPGTRVYNTGMTAAQLRAALGVSGP